MNELGVNASGAGPALADLVADRELAEWADFPLRRLAEESDTPIVRLVPHILGEDSDAAEAALAVVSQGIAVGPRSDAALLDLAKAARDESRRPEARTRARSGKLTFCKNIK